MTSILFAVVAVWFLLNIIYYQMQPSMIFFPSADLVATPKTWNLSYDDVWLESEGHKIHGWWIPGDVEVVATHHKTLLYFHGNAENISTRREAIIEFHELGLDQLIIDYSGYGLSQGEVSERAMYSDAQAAWQYVRQVKRVEANQIVIFGRSLGGAVAMDLAASLSESESAAALILESTFTSIREMAKRVVPVISPIIYQRYRFDSITKIKRYHGPLLVIHGRDDEIIPFFMGEQLYAAANQDKRFVAIDGDHNSGFLREIERHKREVLAFVQSL